MSMGECLSPKHAQLSTMYKGRAIKELVVCNNWDLEPLDLLNGLALGCYRPSPEVLYITLIFLNWPYFVHNFKSLLSSKSFLGMEIISSKLPRNNLIHLKRIKVIRLKFHFSLLNKDLYAFWQERNKVLIFLFSSEATL